MRSAKYIQPESLCAEEKTWILKSDTDEEGESYVAEEEDKEEEYVESLEG